MNNEKRTIRTLSHSYYDLKYHIVWTLKYRGKVLNTIKIKSELRIIFESMCNWKHWQVIELSIQESCIYLVISLESKDSVFYTA